MADQGKGGDNRFFQLLIVLITTVVGPLLVFFVTNGVKNAPPASQPTVVQAAQTTQPQQVEPTSPVSQPTSTLAVETAVPTPTLPTETVPVPAASPTAALVQDPRGVVPAGIPVVVDNFALWLEPDDVRVEGSYLHLNIHLRNLDSSPRSLTFAPAAITVKDSTGKVYSPYSGEKKDQCKHGDLDTARKIQLASQQELLIKSAEVKSAAAWCAKDKNDTIPLYIGPIQPGIKSLLVQFNKLGPFEGFSIELAK